MAAACPGACSPARRGAAANRAAAPRLCAGLLDSAAADRQTVSSAPARTDPRDRACAGGTWLERCRDTVDHDVYPRVLTSLVTDPERARDQLAAWLHDAQAAPVAPFLDVQLLVDRPGACRPPTARPRRQGRRARILAHARSSSMAARRRDRRGTVAADANELCPTPISVSALLITGLSF
jgi:hypothetical protein